MHINRIVALSILVVCLLLFSFAYKNDVMIAQATPTSISGKFYKFDEVAKVGADNLTFIGGNVSINDNGTVAFVGLTSGVGQVFARNVTGPLRAVTNPTVPDPGRNIGDVQINNSNKIITMSGWGDIIDGVREVRVWNGDAVESSVLAANAHFGSSPPAYDMWQIWAVSLNNTGLPAFTGGGQAVFTGYRDTGFTSAANNNISISAPIAVADNGSVVLKEHNLAPIKLYSNNLQTSTDIATISSSTFSSLGKSPGISDDGEIIAFYGDLATGSNAGPGIFLSIPKPTGGRQIYKVAGRLKREMAPLAGGTWGNRINGCEVNEPCYGELGLDASNNPLYLDSFVSNSRIGIIHQEFGPAGLDGDAVVLCFLATPNAADNNPNGYFSNQIGIWTT